MIGKIRQLLAYQTSSGKFPVWDWLKTLHDNIQVRIRKRLERMRIGDFGDSKYLEDGIFEARIHAGSGDKSSQEKDIKKAKEYFYDYKKRISAGSAI